MKQRWVPAVLVAVVGGAVLSGCGTTQANSPTAESSTGAGNSSPSGAYGALGVSSGDQPSTAAGPNATPQKSTASPNPTHSASSTPSAPKPQNVNSAATVATSPGSGLSGGTNFTVPAIPGNNVVSAWGSYRKLNAERVQVSICAKQTGTAFSVGALALAYNTSGATKNLGAVVLTGPGQTSCGTMTFLFYSAHLTVHAFIGGNNGTITTTGPVLNLY